MARTVEDLQLLFSVIGGYDYADPASSPVPLMSRDPHKQNLRIGYYVDDGFSAPTAETRNAVEQAADALEDAGYQVEPFLPDELAQPPWPERPVAADHEPSAGTRQLLQ